MRGEITNVNIYLLKILGQTTVKGCYGKYKVACNTDVALCEPVQKAGVFTANTRKKEISAINYFQNAIK